jgi:hypothetical protein
MSRESSAPFPCYVWRPLSGRSCVRYIILDEAGTAANEPVRVVVGIIVHADEQCLPAEEAVRSILGLIPPHLRERLPVFHAKTIWGDEKLREHWSFKDRKFLLQAMMSIPRILGLALAIGACRSDTDMPPEVLNRITSTQAQHAIAFQECIARADSWIDKYAEANEVATVIAEDVPQSKKLLRHVAKWLQDVGYGIPRKDVRLEYPVSKPLINIDEFRKRKVCRIRLPIHFVDKSDEPLLQIADACAFGFRRFLARQKFGDEFVHTIIGEHQEINKYPIDQWGGGIFSWTDLPNVPPP